MTHPQNEFEYSLSPLQFLFSRRELPVVPSPPSPLFIILIRAVTPANLPITQPRNPKTFFTAYLLLPPECVSSQVQLLLSASFEFRYVFASVKILAQVLIMEPNFSHLVLLIFCALKPEFPPAAFQYMYIFYFPYHERQLSDIMQTATLKVFYQLALT